MRTVTKISQLTVAAALGLSLAACGSSSSSGGGTSAAGATGSATSQGGQAASSATGGSSDTGSAGASDSSSSASSSSAGSDQAGVPDAKTLVHQARTAYRKAKSAHLHANIKDGSKTEIVDIKGTVDGTNQAATISQTGQGTANLRTVSGTTYLKADKTFWTKASGAPETTAGLLADKWVVAPTSTKSKLASVTIKAFMDGFLGEDSLTDSDLAKAKSSKSSYNGKDVYLVTDNSASGGTMTLDADTKDFLRLLPPASESDSGAVTADGWNQQSKVEAPPNPVKVPSSAGK